MQKKFKKVLALLCAAALLLATAACGANETQSGAGGSSQQESSATSQDAASESGAQGEAGEGELMVDLPLTQEEVVFTMFMPGIDNMTSSFDLEDNIFTKKIYDETGIKLEFLACTPAERQEKLSVLLNAGEYPDLIRDINMKKNDVQYYADQGIFISLDEYGVREYPNIKAALEEFPTMAEALECSDGKFYVLPEVNNAIHNTYRGGRLHYYMPWFRDNDIEVPQTLDEFTEYLRWVKTGDANGNGKADEIPLAFWKDESIVRNTISALAKPFMPWVMTDTYWGLAVEDGAITEQYRDDRFHEALRYMHIMMRMPRFCAVWKPELPHPLALRTRSAL